MSIPSLRERVASEFPAALLPLWAVALLLPFGRSAELGVLLCLAGCLLLRDPARRASLRGRWPLFVALWACYAGAAAISALDAVNPDKSWGTVLAALRLLPLGLYAALVAAAPARQAALQTGIAVVVAFWLLDAWVQAATGWGLAGAPEAERLSGVFGSENLKLGPVLATLSPFLLIAARRRWGWRGLVAAFVLVLVPVLLAGSRASWFAFGLVALAMLWTETRRPLRFAAALALLAAGFAVAVVVAAHGSSAFDARIQRTLQALSGSEANVDFALAGRARIWQTSVAMIEAHPVNGVGVRGFRYAYADYAAPGDTFVQPDGSGAAHAHQWVLEVLSETGAIGLLLWLAGIVAAVRGWFRADAARRAAAFAPALALVAMTFPLNTHLAFYSAWWGLLFWWLIAQYCAALAGETEIPAHA
ncbi:O-antigen ligase family protein [Tahibacter caeni]|uniref:O-antigen ligase family protein n=1 Tax=Tahibacter caeni TaxID=1453545 RepID=UPI002147864E|nr:O-antigen ligase family protein [Tahibacter caeni]